MIADRRTELLPHAGEVNRWPDLSFSERAIVHKLIDRFQPNIGIPDYQSWEFETESPMGEGNRIAYVDWMVSHARGNQLFRWASDLRYISDNEGKAAATLRINTGPQQHYLHTDPDQYFWSHLNIGNIHNGVDVRNRTRYVMQLVLERVRDLRGYSVERKFEILSIAAGSCYGILRALASAPESRDKVRVRLIDHDEDAIRLAVQLARSLQLEECLEVVLANAFHHTHYLRDEYSPDIVEIVGLFDYFSDRHIQSLLSGIRKVLKPGAQVLFSNIDNRDVPGEDKFRREVVGWREMIHRSADHVLSLAATVPASLVEHYKTPHQVYNLAKITIAE